MIDVKWIEKTVPDRVLFVQDHKKYIMVFLNNMRVRITKNKPTRKGLKYYEK
jgi:hypothetical protein